MKLTDTHRIVLTAAGGRANASLLPLPKSMKLGAEKRTALLKSLLKAGLASEKPASDGVPPWRTEDATGPQMLLITPAGLAAVGIESAEDGFTRSASPTKKSLDSKRKGATQSTSTSTGHSRPAMPNPKSKLGLLVSALRGKKGATLDDLTKATGWMGHSVRGAISGPLKKKLGLSIDSSVIEGRGRVYRIVE